MRPSVSAPDLVAPAWQSMPPYHDTDGPLVAELCESIGFTPDPEQRLALDWLFAWNRDGRSAARDFGLCAPRQNMKTGLLKMAALGWMFVSELRLVVWSAHEFSTAQEAFRDMCILIESNPDLDREVLRTSSGIKSGIHRGNGEEAIELRGDRRLRFRARTKAGGRGLTGDRIVLDEAMLLQPDMMAALLPTLRAVRDPQVIYAGSAGLLQSEIWRMVRDRGRAGGDPSLAWLEWGDRSAWQGCADPECSHIWGRVDGCALDDEARLWETNTALTSGRITVDTLLADRRSLTPIKYATETLGWWEDPPDEGDGDDTLRGWAAAADPNAAAAAPVSLAISMHTDLRTVSVGLHGAGVVELPEWRKGAGTNWVGPRVAELMTTHGVPEVGVAAGDPAMSLVKKRENSRLGHVLEVGTLALDVRVIPSTVQVAACQAFVTAVNEGRLHHRGQQVLDIAVRDATRVLSGDGWRWSRSKSAGDISPLWSVVLAAHLGATAPPPVDRSIDALLRSFG